MGGMNIHSLSIPCGTSTRTCNRPHSGRLGGVDPSASSLSQEWWPAKARREASLASRPSVFLQSEVAEAHVPQLSPRPGAGHIPEIPFLHLLPVLSRPAPLA